MNRVRVCNFHPDMSLVVKSRNFSNYDMKKNNLSKQNKIPNSFSSPEELEPSASAPASAVNRQKIHAVLFTHTLFQKFHALQFVPLTLFQNDSRVWWC